MIKLSRKNEHKMLACYFLLLSILLFQTRMSWAKSAITPASFIIKDATDVLVPGESEMTTTHKAPASVSKSSLRSSISTHIRSSVTSLLSGENKQHSPSPREEPLAVAQAFESSSTAPDVKWISSGDFLELVKYLFEQAKTISYTNFVIIDTRNSNEYNGWKSFDSIYASLDFNKTGLLPLYDMKNGHVQDARNFDADWLHLFDPDSLKQLVTQRIGIKLKTSPNEPFDPELAGGDLILPVVLYDTRKARLEKVKNYLVDNFLVNLVYICKLEESEMSNFLLRSNQTNTDVSNLFFQEPFYDMLLSAEVLNAILRPFNNSNIIDVKPITDYKLFDVSKGGADVNYEHSHIPTAVHLNVNELEHEHKRKNKIELAKLFLDMGIRANNSEMIILYGNPDPMASFRAALIMKSMGIRDIHILNGGFRSWLIKSLPVESHGNKPTSIKKTAHYDEQVKMYIEQSFFSQNQINYLVDQNYIADLIKNYDLFAEQYELIDVRTFNEFVGSESGYDDLKQRGRIPHSVWGRGGTQSDQLEDYRNPDLTMRSGVELLKMWDQLGIDYKFKHLIFYCGNGWRASEVMFYAELMGLYRISMYDGGWYDWSSNLNNTVMLGLPNENNQTVQLTTSESDVTTVKNTVGQNTPQTVVVVGSSASTSSNFKHQSVSSSHAQNKTSKAHETSVSAAAVPPTLLTTTTPNSIKHTNKISTNMSDFYYKTQFDNANTISRSASTHRTPRLLTSMSIVLMVFVYLRQ